MDCFQDFCLACDRESTDGPYCSQTCRMADLERAHNGASSSPTSPTSMGSRPRGQTSSSFNGSTGYVLSPAYNFSAKSHGHSTEAMDRRDSYFVRSPTQSTFNDIPRSLTPSSSRTSLSSSSSLSNAASGGMSERAKAELQGYFSSLDQARAAKRRSSTR